MQRSDQDRYLADKALRELQIAGPDHGSSVSGQVIFLSSLILCQVLAVFGNVKESASVVRGGRDGAAGRPLRDPAARRVTGQPGRRPWSGAGVGRGNGAAGSAVSGQSSGGGQGNNGTRVHENSLANVGTSRNVLFSQGVDTSVGQGARRPSGRGSHTLPSRGRGVGADKDHEQAHSTPQFPSPHRNEFLSPAIFWALYFGVEGVRIGRKRGGGGITASLLLLT